MLSKAAKAKKNCRWRFVRVKEAVKCGVRTYVTYVTSTAAVVISPSSGVGLTRSIHSQEIVSEQTIANARTGWEGWQRVKKWMIGITL